MTKKHIMYIDYEPMQRMMYGIALQHKFGDSIDITLEPSAETALARIHKEPGKYSAILSDYRMPGLDGLTFLTILNSLLRESRSEEQVYRLLTTDYPDPKLPNLALELGADFLHRPFKVADFASQAYERYERFHAARSNTELKSYDLQ
ncbi:hypothetical protein J4437_00850 [Candidatus Woesearchaeota archaeon]|nr:hypothetical protein [Candidatus Woesearchaeota archaeon]